MNMQNFSRDQAVLGGTLLSGVIVGTCLAVSLKGDSTKLTKANQKIVDSIHANIDDFENLMEGATNKGVRAVVKHIGKCIAEHRAMLTDEADSQVSDFMKSGDLELINTLALSYRDSGYAAPQMEEARFISNLILWRCCHFPSNPFPEGELTIDYSDIDGIPKMPQEEVIAIMNANKEGVANEEDG